MVSELTDWGRVWDGILPLSRQTNPSRRGGISGVSQSETSLHFSQIERGQLLLRSTVSWTNFNKTLFFYYTLFGSGNGQGAMEISIFRHSLTNRIRGSLPGNARITRLISIKSISAVPPHMGNWAALQQI